MKDKSSELCEVCGKTEYTRLCDYEVGTGVVTSLDWQELTKTCDKKLCNKCTTLLWRNCDVCPEHAAEVKNRLFKEEDNTHGNPKTQTRTARHHPNS